MTEIPSFCLPVDAKSSTLVFQQIISAALPRPPPQAFEALSCSPEESSIWVFHMSVGVLPRKLETHKHNFQHLRKQSVKYGGAWLWCRPYPLVPADQLELFLDHRRPDGYDFYFGEVTDPWSRETSVWTKGTVLCFSFWRKTTVYFIESGWPSTKLVNMGCYYGISRFKMLPNPM